MKATLLPRYLLGSRDAIIEIAASRWSLPIGILFVISAGLAREYDGEDLVNEPWHALRPLGASLATGTMLFLLVHCAALLRHDGTGDRPCPGWWRSYRAFMGLFWMTAPMAWFYAVPYERMMEPVEAISLNLWTLAIVAGWRMILMMRVVGVLYGFGPVSCFFLVMLFGDAVAFAVIGIVPRPVIDVMGGLRLAERDQLVANVTFMLGLWTFLTAPVWIIGAIASAMVLRPKFALPSMYADRGGRGLLALAVLAVLAFVVLAVFTQGEQVNRRAAEAMLRDGRVQEAFAYMSARRASDFPPHWNPPPRLGYRETEPPIDTIMQEMDARWPAQWVADTYLDKVRRFQASWALHDVERFEGDPGAAEFLLRHDDRLTSRDRNRYAAVAAWVNPGRLAEVDDATRTRVLVRAISEERIDLVRRALEAGASPDAPDAHGRDGTPLGAAVMVNSSEIITLLLDAGADIDRPPEVWGDDLASPAHLAAYHGHNAALRSLLDRGADPRLTTPGFGSLITAASFDPHTETVRLLLARDAGIDLEARAMSEELTALHLAYRSGSEALVRLLLDAGADADALTVHGKRPIDFRR